MSVDPLCRHADGSDWSFPTTKEHILDYTAIECGLRGLDPRSVKEVYLNGILSYFTREDRGEIFKAAKDSPAVTNQMKGFQKLYNKLHPMSDRIKMAFGMDLARLSKSVMMETSAFVTAGRSEEEVQLRRDRTYVVMTVGINFMFRKGEHICKKNGAPSGLTRSNITFLDYSGKVIPYALIGAPGFRAKKMTINTQFSKTDHSGFGRRPWHERQENPAKEEVCVVTQAERWIAFTRDRYGAEESSELYDVPGVERVDVDVLHRIMQDTTIKAAGGEKINRLSTTHSFRYGGATMMASAGFPQYLIAHYGGWSENSTALRKYVRPSDASISRVSEIMTTMALGNPSKLYIEDALAASSKRRSSAKK